MAGLLVLMAVVVIGVHLAPVRALVLRTVLPLAESRANLKVTAGRLDYNLFRLSATVHGVRVAASQTPDVPFFEAERVTVSVPPLVLRGIFSLNRIDIVGGQVRIIRTPAGSNLPTSSRPSTAEPAALRLGRITGDLAIDVRDDVARFVAAIPHLSMDLSPIGGHLVAERGQLQFRGQPIAVAGLSGSASFDGRAVTLSGMYLATDVTSVRVDGPLTVITRSPRMELQIAGDGDVARMTALVTPTRIFDGRVRFAGTLAGPFSTPVTDVRVSSDRLRRDALSLTEVALAARVSTTTVDVSQAAFGLAGGRVDATAQVVFDGTSSRVDGKWANVDLSELIRSLVSRPPAVLPAGPTSGTVASRGAGFDIGAWTTDADVSVGTVANAPQRLAVPGRSRLHVARRSWQLEGAHQAADVAPVALSLTGRVEANGQIPLGGTVTVQMTDVAALSTALTQVGLADIPPTLFTAGSLTATATAGGDLARPMLDGMAVLEGLKGQAFALGPTSVGFGARLFDGDVQLEAHADSAEIAGQSLRELDVAAAIRDSAVTITRLTAVEADASGTLVASGRYQFETQAYELQSQIANWLMRGTAQAPIKGTLNASFNGTGTIERPAGDVRATIADGFYADLPLGQVTAQAMLDGTQARFTADVPRLSVQSRGTTGLRAPYATTLDVDVNTLDLAQLQPLVDVTRFTLRGTAGGTAHIEGTPSAWQDAEATATLTAAEAVVGDLVVALDGPAQLYYRSRSVGTVRLGARAGGVLAEVRGSLPIDPQPASNAAMTLTVIGDVGEVFMAARSTRMVDLPLVTGTGPVAVMARVEGALRAPEVTADIDVGPATLNSPDLPPLERVRILGHVEDGKADVQDLSVFVDGAEVSATASAPLAWFSTVFPAPTGARAMATLSAQLKNVTADLLGRLTMGSRVPDLQGSLDAVVELSSANKDLSDLTGEVRIDRLDVSAAGLAVTQAMPTRVVARGGTAQIESWDWRGEGSNLSVSGQVRLADLDAAIMAGGQLDLRLLSPFLRASGLSLAGVVTPRLSITGSLRTPSIEGDVVLSDADVRLASPRVFISDLDGRAIFQGDRLQIQTMTGQINGGDLTVQGSLPIRDGPLTAALTAMIRGMALEYPDGLRTELDGDLTFHIGEEGEVFEGIPVLQGSVQIVNGSYREPVTVVGGVLAALQARASAVPPPLVATSSRPVTLDVIVTSNDDIVVDNNAATAQVDVDLRVGGTTAQPVLSGRAEVREGGRVLLGRNTYQVTAGSLYFANPSRIDPELNFDLTTRAGGVSINVQLTGTASAPKVALTDENGELAQSDLTSLLLTGRTLDQLGSADAEVVGTVLVGNLSGEVGQVLGLAGRVVGIDTIRLGGIDDTGLRNDPTAIVTDTDPTTRLTFTKSIGANIDVTLSQSLRNGDQQTWVVEYAPSRRLLARLVSNDDDLRSYEFRHDVLFGSKSLERTAPRTRREPGRVSEVTITGELPGQDVRRLLKLEVGETFDFATLQSDRDRLEEFYRTQGYITVRVGARQTTTGEMVAVAFTIQPGPRTRIEVMGMAVSDDMVKAVSQVWSDSLAGPLLIDEVRTLVGDRLAQQGYFRARVDVSLAEVDGVQVLRVAADPGPRSTKVQVVLDGVTDDLRDDLSKRLAAQKIVQGAPRNPQLVSNSLQLALRELGYLDPRVAIDSPVFEGEQATVNVHIQSGDQVLLGTVTVKGSTLDMEQVRAALDLTEGLSYLQAAVDNAETRLTSFYRQEGYPSATVTLRTVPQPAAGAIGVEVTVVEGPRQMIDSIAVEGLRNVAEASAIDAMTLKVGEPARAEDILRARTRLFATGLFRRVDVAPAAEPTGPVTSDRIPTRIVATVEEWPVLRFRYGFQVAEEYPDDNTGHRELVPGVSADLTRRTLFGLPISVGAATVLQRRDRLGRVFITAPTFIGLPIRSSLIVQKDRALLPADFVSDKVTISWEQRAKPVTHLNLLYAFRVSREHSFNSVPNPLQPVPEFWINAVKLTNTVAWDTRNDPAAPVRGLLLSGSLDYAPEALGSQITFVRYFTQARHFRQVGRVVLASAAQYGVVVPLGGQEIFGSDRFFTGGGTSIRGLPDEGAGPKGFGGAPAGGRVLLLFNQEARVPLVKWFQGVTFVDAGNVFDSPGDTSLSRLTTSIGAGLRIVTPFALLRVDVGHVVHGVETETGRTRIIFGIGHIF